jgi:hypothetical protein
MNVDMEVNSTALIFGNIGAVGGKAKYQTADAGSPALD